MQPYGAVLLERWRVPEMVINCFAPARVTYLEEQPLTGCIFWSGVRAAEGDGFENH